MFRIETPRNLPVGIRAGVVLRSQRTNNPKGVSLWPAGTHSSREVDLTRRLLFHQLDRTPGDIRYLHQIHGDRVVHRKADETQTGKIPSADAHWTNDHTVVLTANIADCCPVVFIDTNRHAVGLAHSGWRGTAASVAPKLLDTILTKVAGTSIETLLAWVGPCAGGEHYEVGREVAERFSPWPHAIKKHEDDPNKVKLDVRTSVVAQLQERGVPAEQIEVSTGDTIGLGRYHSYRRDRFAAGRMLAFVTIDP